MVRISVSTPYPFLTEIAQHVTLMMAMSCGVSDFYTDPAFFVES